MAPLLLTQPVLLASYRTMYIFGCVPSTITLQHTCSVLGSVHSVLLFLKSFDPFFGLFGAFAIINIQNLVN